MTAWWRGVSTRALKLERIRKQRYATRQGSTSAIYSYIDIFYKSSANIRLRMTCRR